MKPYLFTIALFLITTTNSIAQQCNDAAAKKFLERIFTKGQYTSYDSTLFRGYRILRPVNTPLLNRLLPGYCFYTTYFLSNYYEYSEVETVLAFSRYMTQKSVLTHSPTFTKESLDFIHLFYGIQTTDTTQSIAVAKEITGIFSKITTLGHVNRLINLKETSVISFELWQGDLSWRIFDFYFDNTHKLIHIKATAGVKRHQMKEGYMRP